nr:hypothetical protein B0A51_12533 [Rachicladosporium sp. CCFEE 5018]
MARSRSSRSVSRTRVIVRQSYYWPDQQLNFWLLVMLATGGVLVGVFASFVTVQNALGLGIPWIIPFGIAVGGLTVIFILVMLALISQRRLLPGVVILGSFILLVLYVTGLIETAIQLFGPQGNVNGNCTRYILTSNHPTGLSINTLAWLEQQTICQAWQAAFAFWIIGAVFLVWMIILGSIVARGGTGDR